jgi:metallo-beta-lactamase family protein
VSEKAKRRGFAPLGRDDVLRVTFHGAAGEVTGSCYLVETHAANLLVDCGMFQGGRAESAKNRRAFPFDPRGLDAVVLTHAHIDHSGLLPKLVRDGFAGDVFATGPTADLLAIMLPDSAHIHEQDAARDARRARRRKGKSARVAAPLYTGLDAQRALEQVRPRPFDETFEAAPGVLARYRRNGHILGASSVELVAASGPDGGPAGIRRRVVFSGDVGRVREPMLRDPDPPREADLLLLESTYGDRDHREHAESLDELARVLEQAALAHENVIVPVFAVGRAQEVLAHIATFERSGRLAQRPVYLDSPMAIRVTELSRRHAECFRAEVRAALERREGVDPAGLEFCRTPDESMALNAKHGALILAASGMCEGGRVMHHLKHNLWRDGSHVVIVGFQAQGTLGRALVDGARSVRLLGEEVAVRASVHTIGGFSAHGGQSELVAWARDMLAGGADLALVHGEPPQRDALAARLAGVARHDVAKPMPGDAVVLRARGPRCAWATHRPAGTRARPAGG